MNNNIVEYGKNTRFSKENQPDPKKKRVPKWKAHLKKMLKENYEEINKEIMTQCKKGSIKHIEFVRDWIYGKLKQEIEYSGTITEVIRDISDEELDKRINELES